MKEVDGSSNPVANAAILITSAITSPGDAVTIRLPDTAAAKANKNWKPGHPWFTTDAAPKPQASISASSHYMVVVLIVTILTLLTGAAYVAMAWWWPAPTPNQQSAFETMGSLAKFGFGAIAGLLGGKTIR